MTSFRSNMFFLIIPFILLLLPSLTFGNDDTTDRVTIAVTLDVELETGFLGLPEGVKEPGREAYIDLDTDTLIYREYGGPAPEGWDLVCTYIVRDVSMGPMGTHPVPYLTIRANSRENAAFYHTDESYASIRAIQFPRKVETSYEFPTMKRLTYSAGKERPCIIRSTDGRIVKLRFTDIQGLRDDKRLFSVEFEYQDTSLTE